jgi:hypothetical protein
VDVASSRGTMPLHLACEAGFAAVVELLLAAGADADAAMETDGTTPILYATENGHADVVKMLLAAGAKANLARDAPTPTPNALACCRRCHCATVVDVTVSVPTASPSTAHTTASSSNAALQSIQPYLCIRHFTHRVSLNNIRLGCNTIGLAFPLLFFDQRVSEERLRLNCACIYVCGCGYLWYVCVCGYVRVCAPVYTPLPRAPPRAPA